MKKYVKAASDSDSPFGEMLSNLEADFEYIVDGFEKLQRMGLEKEAIRIGSTIEAAFKSVDSDISELMQ